MLIAMKTVLVHCNRIEKSNYMGHTYKLSLLSSASS